MLLTVGTVVTVVLMARSAQQRPLVSSVAVAYAVYPAPLGRRFWADLRRCAVLGRRAAGFHRSPGLGGSDRHADPGDARAAADARAQLRAHWRLCPGLPGGRVDLLSRPATLRERHPPPSGDRPGPAAQADPAPPTAAAAGTARAACRSSSTLASRRSRPGASSTPQPATRQRPPTRWCPPAPPPSPSPPRPPRFGRGSMPRAATAPTFATSQIMTR